MMFWIFFLGHLFLFSVSIFEFSINPLNILSRDCLKFYQLFLLKFPKVTCPKKWMTNSWHWTDVYIFERSATTPIFIAFPFSFSFKKFVILHEKKLDERISIKRNWILKQFLGIFAWHHPDFLAYQFSIVPKFWDFISESF